MRVPVANARRLVENLRTSAPAASVELVEIAGAGACPHEEGDLSQKVTWGIHKDYLTFRHVELRE